MKHLISHSLKLGGLFFLPNEKVFIRMIRVAYLFHFTFPSGPTQFKIEIDSSFFRVMSCTNFALQLIIVQITHNHLGGFG